MAREPVACFAMNSRWYQAAVLSWVHTVASPCIQATVVLQAYKVLTAVTKHSTALAAASPKGAALPMSTQQ